MLKNVSYYPTIAGAIRLGEVNTTSAGVSFFVPTEHMQITYRHKDVTSRNWVTHPLHQALVDAHAVPSPSGRRRRKSAEQKLREIPVRLLFARADLNSTERYEAYDKVNARFICAGNGQRAKRITHEDAIEELDCRPMDCEFGRARNCSVRGRTIVAIEGQLDPLAGFLIRTGTVRGASSMRVQIEHLCARHAKYIQGLPLILSIGKVDVNDTTMYFPQLQIRGEEADAIATAKAYMKKMRKLGVDFNQAESRLADLALGSPLNITEVQDLDSEFPPSKPFSVIAPSAASKSTSLPYRGSLASAIASHKRAAQPQTV